MDSSEDRYEALLPKQSTAKINMKTIQRMLASSVMNMGRGGYQT